MRYTCFFFLSLLCLACNRVEQPLLNAPENYLLSLDTALTVLSEKEKEAFIDSVLACFEAKDGEFDTLRLAEVFHQAGRNLLPKKKNNEAQFFFKESFRLRKLLFKSDNTHIDMLRSYTMLGESNMVLTNYRTAIAYLDTAFSCGPPKTLFRTYILCKKGSAYLSINELNLASACFQAALDSARMRYPGNETVDSWLPDLYKDYVSCARKKGDYKLGIELSKASNGIAYADLQMLLGNLWQDSMNYCRKQNRADWIEANDSAILYNKKALDSYSKDGNYSGALLAIGNLGGFYYRVKEYQKAVKLLSKALTNTAFDSLPQREFAALRANFGDALCETGQMEAGLAQYHKAILCFRSNNSEGEPLATDFETKDFPDLLMTFSAIASSHLRRNDPTDLPMAVKAYKMLVDLTKLSRNELVTQSSMFHLAEKNQEALSNAVGVCAQLFQITSKEEFKENAFYFAEQSKGFALLEAVRLRQLGTATPTQKERQASALNEISITEFQRKLLSPDQGLVSYYTQDTLLNIFLIKSDTLIWHRSTLQQDSLQDWAQKFQNLVRDPDQSTIRDPVKEHASGTYGNILYKTLLAPLKASLPPRLVIVAAAPFLGLPFEDFSEHPFMGSLEKQVQQKNLVLFQHSITYAVSANVWAEMTRANRSRGLENKVAAFAPSFHLKSDPSALAGILAPMENTKTELEHISQEVPVSAFSDSNAIKSAFEAAAKRFNILHLASHSICNDGTPDRSLLAFYQPGPMVDTGQLLYLRELYGLELEQDLIVLSACETSKGEFALGEGNLSIARGLAYAGARSFVSTLWVINTEPGITIMPAFYKKLKAGKSKDVALAEAKREYLMNSPKNYAPLKWAGIVLNGSTKPINFSDDAYLPSWLWFLAVVIGLFGTWLFWKRNQRK